MHFKRKRKIANAKIYEAKRDLYCTCCCARASCCGARMYLLLRMNELLRRTDVPAAAHERAAAAHGCTCCCARTSCCGARMYLLLRTNELHSCDSTIFHISVRSSRYIRATAQLFIFPCAAAGTFVRQHNFSYFRAQQQVHSCDSTTFHISVRSSRYIRAQQQLIRAQQQVHPCAAAARSCAAAGTSVRSSSSFVRSRIVLLGHRTFAPHRATEGT